MIIVSPLFLKIISGNFARAMAIFPFIIVKSESLKNDRELINHEKIHFKQQLELFLIPFYIWYFLEYIIRYAKYRNQYLAYRHISFEREAYDFDQQLNYLQYRKPYAFLKKKYFFYLKKNDPKN